MQTIENETRRFFVKRTVLMLVGSFTLADNALATCFNKCDTIMESCYRIDCDECIACGECYEECPHEAIYYVDKCYVIDHLTCTCCGTCASVCSVGAIKRN